MQERGGFQSAPLCFKISFWVFTANTPSTIVRCCKIATRIFVSYSFASIQEDPAPCRQSIGIFCDVFVSASRQVAGQAKQYAQEGGGLVVPGVDQLDLANQAAHTIELAALIFEQIM